MIDRTMPSALLVRDLQKRYGTVLAAQGVSFDIRAGEVFGLLGPNGAGKTTTIECVLGLREPDAGEITVGGVDARRQPAVVKEKIGASLQATALQDKITPREALTLFGSFYARGVPAAELIDRFALGDKADAPFDSLSGGQRQRLALALAFVNRPEIVVLDEPTAGLDPSSRHELHGEITRMRRDGYTVLLTTHDLDEAEVLCDRIAIIDHGRIVATGAPHELVAGSRNAQTVSAIAAGPLAASDFADLAGAEELTVDGSMVRCRTTAVTRTVTDLMARLDARGVGLVELHVQKATLEQVFLELTRDAGVQA